MESEHVHPLFRFGYSSYYKMKAACKHCNRAKGTKLLEDQVMYPAIRQMNAIIIIDDLSEEGDETNGNP